MPCPKFSTVHLASKYTQPNCESDNSATDGGCGGFDGRHSVYKFHPLLRQTLDP